MSGVVTMSWIKKEKRQPEQIQLKEKARIG